MGGRGGAKGLRPDPIGFRPGSGGVMGGGLWAEGWGGGWGVGWGTASPGPPPPPPPPPTMFSLVCRTLFEYQSQMLLFPTTSQPELSMSHQEHLVQQKSTPWEQTIMNKILQKLLRTCEAFLEPIHPFHSTNGPGQY